MYNVSDELKNKLNSNSVTTTARLTFSNPQLVIDENNLVSLKLKDCCYNEGRIIGTNIAKDVEIVIKNNNYNLQDREFYLEIGILLDNGKYEYIPYGYFIIDTVEDTKSNNEYKITAMDYMIKLNQTFVEFDAKEYPMTMKQFLQKFAKQYNIELVSQTLPNENLQIPTIPYFTDMSGRTVLKNMAEVFGRFAKFNREGKLEFVLRKNVAEQISRDNMNSNLEIDNQYGEVNVVSILLSDDIIGENVTLKDEESIALYGENIIKIVGNEFLNTQDMRNAAIQSIFNELKGFKYIPTSFTYMAKPYLDCGDTILVQDMETDEYYESIVLNHSIEIAALRKSKMENLALTKVEVESQFTPEDIKRNSRTEARVDKVEKKISLVVEEQTTQSNRITNVEKETNTVASNLNTFINETYSNDISNLQDQIDGAIQFWNGESIPTLSNYPASEWTTEEQRNNHRADIYTVIQDIDGEMKQGKSYRFDKVGTTWQWVELTDNELSAVQALANSKAKVYVTTPIVPYNVGDLWLKDKELYECIKSKDASGSYSASDWVKATKYTDDTKANEVDGKLTTTNEKVASIEINLDSVTTRVSSTETKVTQVETTANTAKSTADTAKNTADTAKNTAESAKSTANTANTNSNTAISTANTAKTNSETAVNTANTANTNASNAVSTANTASTNASNALSTANTAKSTADEAQNTANATAKEIVTTNTKVASIETNLTSITSRLSETETGIKDIEQAIDTEDRFIKQTEVQIDSVDNILDNVEMYGKLEQDAKVSSNILKSFGAGETGYFALLTNVYTSDTNYYKAEPLADSWIHVECDVTGLASDSGKKYIGHFIAPNKIPKLKTSTTYTIIYEFRNVDITTMSQSLNTFKTLESASNYFSINQLINDSTMKNYNGKMYKIKSTTLSTFSGKYVMRNYHEIYSGDKFSYDYRISVLEGDKLNQDYTYEEYANRPSPEEEARITVIGDNINLFDKNNNIELDGKFRAYRDGTISEASEYFGIKIPVNSNTTYVTNIGKGYTSNLCFFDNNMNYLSGVAYNTEDKTFTTPNNCKYITLALQKSYKDILKIEQGTVATGYTSYGNGGIDYKTVGKNLLKLIDGTFSDKGVSANVQNGKITLSGTPTSGTSFLKLADFNFTFKANVDYTINLNPSYYIDGYETRFRFSKSNGNIVVKDIYFSSTSSVITFSFTEDTSCEWIQIRTGSSITYNNLVLEPQLELDSVASEYEPYKEHIATIELPQGEFMAKIGDYEDYIDNQGVLHKYIGKVVLDGSEEWNKLNLTFYAVIKWGKPNAICTHFIDNGSSWVSSDEALKGKFTTTNVDNQFKCMPLSDMTLTDFKTWLSQNKPVIYYVLAEPYNVEITSENRKKYLNLPTMEGINNIYISASTSGTYKRNTEMNKVYAKQNYVDEKFAEQVITNDNITSRVSATETTISNQSSDISSLNESIGSVNSDINNLQSNVETVKTQYTELKETVESFNFDVVTQIQQQLEDGTVTSNQVKTTSVTIDQDGIKVAKSGSEMQSLFDNEGLYVNKGAIDKTETKNNTLTVDKDGVVTENLYVRTYLTAGYHRTEGFIEDGEKRTGVFYQGGVNE